MEFYYSRNSRFIFTVTLSNWMKLVYGACISAVHGPSFHLNIIHFSVGHIVVIIDCSKLILRRHSS